MALLHACNGRQYLARRAVAALVGIIVEEGLLHGMQRLAFTGKPFDGCDLMALHGYRESKATKHGFAIEQNCA